ncbi:MAG: hypothetical protein WBR26_10990 [Candidatus Acidiferrum sp.]
MAEQVEGKSFIGIPDESFFQLAQTKRDSSLRMTAAFVREQ